MAQTALDALVCALTSRQPGRSEATLQADVRNFLLTAPFNLDKDQLEVVLEASVDGGRIDIEVGATVLETKRDLRAGSVRERAVAQLTDYVLARSDETRQRYVGVLTDGAEWRCYHLDGKQLVEADALEGNITSDKLVSWLEGVLATTRDVKPNPELVRSRLGAGTSAHKLDKATLWTLYAANRNSPGVLTSRRLWAKLLETALGTQFDDSDELFVEHTLLVNTAEIIAHAVLGLDVQHIAPSSLVSGIKFDEADIHGAVEADFFDWVVHVAGGDRFIRTLARRVARFDWGSVNHDVLKVLYESVIGADTRKRLGEYYTPDWLAEAMVARAVPEPLRVKVLDPACGSGTFLFHLVRKYLDAADAAGIPNGQALAEATENVVGMDLHPVAVTLARVTYLLAIGKARLAADRSAIHLPVYLADSLQWQESQRNLFTATEFTVRATDDRELFDVVFKFPQRLLTNAAGFDALVKELAEKAGDHRRRPGTTPGIGAVCQRHAVPDEVRATIIETFTTLCRLHDEGRDHIWGYYIRNIARPRWMAQLANRVDVLIGNPPWLSYRFMPDSMQRVFRELCQAKGLWHGAQNATHQDLSALFVVRCIELYLKVDGRFAVVMPNAVIDRAYYAGFRAGTFENTSETAKVQFDEPWDLRRLRPHFFPRGAAVVFGARAERARELPRLAEIWRGRLPPGSHGWSEVAAAIERSQDSAQNERSTSWSPYRERFRQGAILVPRMMFLVDRTSAGPLGQRAGRVFVRSVRSKSEKLPWRDLPGDQEVVESEFIRSTCLGETILPYRALEPRTAVIPRDAEALLDGSSERLDLYPGLAKWWRRAESVWNQHRTSQLTLLQQIDYHGKLSSQFPMPANRVVYAASGMHVCAARISDRRAIIDSSLYWAAVTDPNEAYYIVAILNSSTLTALVRPYMSYGKDERHIHKHLWRLPIPVFDSDNAAHRELARLAQEAEAEVAQLDIDSRSFVTHRRRIRQLLSKSDTGVRIEQAVEELLR